jgi:hypothetical protein
MRKEDRRDHQVSDLDHDQDAPDPRRGYPPCNEDDRSDADQRESDDDHREQARGRGRPDRQPFDRPKTRDRRDAETRPRELVDDDVADERGRCRDEERQTDRTEPRRRTGQQADDRPPRVRPRAARLEGGHDDDDHDG